MEWVNQEITWSLLVNQLAITCSHSTIETPEQCVKSVQS